MVNAGDRAVAVKTARLGAAADLGWKPRALSATMADYIAWLRASKEAQGKI